MFNFWFGTTQVVFPIDGIQWMFPLRLWMGFWPLHSNDSGLMFIKNTIFDDFHNVCWHSMRHFPHYGMTSTRHQMLRAVSKGKTDEVERLIDEEHWPIDGIVDRQGKFTAITLACHLDQLEVVHLLDLKGANISAPAGKF